MKKIDAQDFVYDQFFTARAHTNPAYVALSPGLTFNAIQRYQWPYVPGILESKSIALYANPLKKGTTSSGTNDGSIRPGFYPGVGLFLDNSHEGAAGLVNTRVGMAIAASISTPRFSISSGIRGYFHQANIKYSNLVFSDQLDNIEGNIYETDAVPPTSLPVRDFGADAGVLVTFGLTDKNILHLGGALTYWALPNTSLSNNANSTSFRYTLHLNVENGIGKQFTIDPFAKIDIQAKQRLMEFGFTTVTGSNSGKSHKAGFVLGSHAVITDGSQNTQAIGGITGIQWASGPFQYQLLFSYDVQVGGLQYTSTKGAWEISFVSRISDWLNLRAAANSRGKGGCEKYIKRKGVHLQNYNFY